MLDRARLDLALALLRQRFGDRLVTGEAMRRQHANALTYHRAEPPDAVVFALTSGDVREAVEIAAAHKIPIIAFGAGTSLEGHINAPRGGISLDLSQMSRVLAVNDADLDCTVEAGVSRKALNDHLRDRGLFFPVDPGAETATIGGMAATRASGTNAMRYGTMRDNVLSVTAVMADGTLVRTARRARKSAAGYDLTRLMVGSEGTLGIITELTVRLFGIPEAIRSAVCPFPTLEAACNTVIQAIQLGGLMLARIELLDELQIKACNAYSKLTLDEAPTLFVEFHGSAASVEDGVATFGELASAEGALRFDWAESTEDRNRLWKARHDVYWAVRGLRPGAEVLATDVCVPISRLAECVAGTKRDIADLQLVAPIVGHVGDGNFHVQPLFDPSDPKEMSRIETFVGRLTRRALGMDGTCTGEHGIGQGKIKYLVDEHGPGVAIMQRIKSALDPDGILNPGKVLPGA